MDCETFRERMLDVLYDEADGDTAESVAAHAAACAACAEELAGLREVRASLKSWTLPRLPRTVRRVAPPRYFWAAAAAAVLAVGLGGAAGLAGLEMKVDRGPLTVRLGRSPQAVAPVASQPMIAETMPLQPVNVGETTAPRIVDEAVLRRVEQLIRQSEMRQRTAYEMSLASLEQRTTLQRRYDLARISAGMSYLDGRTGQHMARTTELMGQILQVSNRREP
jgi:hypothetical protein